MNAHHLWAYLRGVQYRRVQTGPAFTIGFAARPEHAYFHYLAVGSAAPRTEDGTLHALSAGNVVLLPQGEAHQLLSGPDAPVQDIGSFAAPPLGDGVYAVDACPSTSPVPARSSSTVAWSST